MACYCGQSQRGVWDANGVLHDDAVCRYTDRVITVNYAGSPGSTDGHSGPETSHRMARNVGLSSIHSGNDKSISMRARASRASIPSTPCYLLTGSPGSVSGHGLTVEYCTPGPANNASTTCRVSHGNQRGSASAEQAAHTRRSSWSNTPRCNHAILNSTSLSVIPSTVNP